MKEILQRNKPIFIIGFITLGIFVGIILLAQKNQPLRPTLINAGDENLITDKTQTMGNKDAKVVVVEFSDYECPACAGYFSTVKKLANELGDKIYLGYRHFPLPQHENSKEAAYAAVAASKQSKFWEYSEKLFTNQENLNEEQYLKFAEELGLNIEQFKSDKASEESKNIIAEDLNLALKLRISATPTFFLNGTQMDIANPTEFELAVRKAVGTPEISQSEETEKSKLKAEKLAESQNQEDVLNLTNKLGDMLVENQTDTDSSVLSATNPDGTAMVNFGYDPFRNTAKIIYTNEGFKPKQINVGLNAKVLWTNTTEKDIYIEQLADKYEEFSNPKLIKSGESFEFTISKDKIWTYQERDTKHFGSITAN